MNDANATTSEGTAPTTSPLRVRPAVVTVALFWIVYLGVGFVEMSSFQRFMIRLGCVAVMTLAYLIWWLSRRSVTRGQRWLVFGATVVGGVIATKLFHPTVMAPAIYILALPALATLWTAWLLVTRRGGASMRGVGMLAIAALVWAASTTVRMEGLSGTGEKADFHWRWTPTAESEFLAERASLEKPGGEQAPAAALVAQAGDWPAFRGPNRDGIVHGVKIAANWSEAPPKEVWRRRVGPGWSSITIVDGRLFTQEQRGDNEAVVCYDAATGDELWAHEDPGRFSETMGGDGPRATPTFDDGRIYALGANGHLNCLDAATGAKIWSADLKKDCTAPIPYWGFSSSPLVVDGRVIVFAGAKTPEKKPEGEASKAKESEDAPDVAEKADAEKPDSEPKAADAVPPVEESLVAYDAATGEIAWKAAAGHISYSSPQLAELGGVRQIVMPSDAGAVGVDPASGAVLWKIVSTEQGFQPQIQPHAASDSTVLVSYGSQAGVELFEVSHTGETWKTDRRFASRELKAGFSDYVAHDGYLYGFDGGIFECVDAATGKRAWKKGRYGSGQVLLVADQPALLVLGEKGEVVLVAADPKKDHELGRFQAIEGKSWSNPTIVGDRLYVRNSQEMACFELK